MANVQVPGFIPYKSRVGGATIANKRVRVTTNNTTAIAYGDCVAKQTDGGWIVIGSTTVSVSSIAQGASYVSSTDGRIERKHLPAATTYTSSGVDPDNASYIYVVEDPLNTIFEASIDEAITMAEIGLNAKVVLGTLSTSGYSGHELDATSIGTGTSLPFRVQDFIRGRAGHDPDAADAHVECLINEGSAAAGLDAPALSTTGT